jgi:pentatricopeptide repeat protein
MGAAGLLLGAATAVAAASSAVGLLMPPLLPLQPQLGRHRARAGGCLHMSTLAAGWEEEDGSSRSASAEPRQNIQSRPRSREIDLNAPNPDSMFNMPSGAMDSPAYSSTLSKYNEENSVKMALATIEEMREIGYFPNLIDYNQVMQVCGVTGSWREALSELRFMRQQGVRPSLETYAFAILSCERSGEASEALQLIRRMQLDGLPRTPLVFELALQACAEGANYDIALELLAMMENDGYTIPATAYECANSAAARSGDWSGSVDMLHRMVDSKFRPSPEAFYAAIDSCVSGGQLKGALELLEGMDDLKIPRASQTIAVGYIMRGCAREGLWRPAVALLNRLKKDMADEDVEHFMPQVYTFAITALERAGEHVRALKLLESMKTNIRPEPKAFHEVMNGCANAGDRNTTVALLQDMEDADLPADITAYNAVMFSFAKAGDVQGAMDLLRTMEKEDGVKPNLYTYNSAILACEKPKKVLAARAMLEKIEDMGLTPNRSSFNAYLSVLAHAGMGHEAKAFLDMCLREGMDPNEASFALTIKACVEPGLGAQALDVMEVMDSFGVRPHGRTYANVILAHLKGGMYRKAMVVVNLILKREKVRSSSLPENINLPILAACVPCIVNGEWDAALDLINQMDTRSDVLELDTLDLWKKAMAEFADKKLSEEALQFVELMALNLEGKDLDLDTAEEETKEGEGTKKATDTEVTSEKKEEEVGASNEELPTSER